MTGATVLTPQNVSELEVGIANFMVATGSGFAFPKIIHQIWFNASPDVPEKWKESPVEWRRLHPGWLYILWSENLASEFVRSFYPDFLKTYEDFPHFIQRVDAIRPLFLKRYGGLYCDLDIVPLVNIEPYITSVAPVYLVNSSYYTKGYTNCLMASNIGAPIWDSIIKRMMEPPKPWAATHSLQVHTTTGPMMLNEVVSRYEDTICRLPRVRFNPTAGNRKGKEDNSATAIVRSLEGGSWEKLDSKVSNFVRFNSWFFIFFLILLLVWCIYIMFRYRHLYLLTITDKKTKWRDLLSPLYVW